MQFGAGEDDEYFSIPRGRVLWNAANQTSVIYHGNGTDQSRLQQIAKVFKLTKWTAHPDIHYMMGSAADRMFDDD